MTSCLPLASSIASWCDTGDIYCDTGNDTTVYGGYFGNYTAETVNWIVDKYNASVAADHNGGSGSGNSTIAVPAPSATSTSVAVPTGSVSATASPRASASASVGPVEGAAVGLQRPNVMVVVGVIGAVGMGLGLF